MSLRFQLGGVALLAHVVAMGADGRIEAPSRPSCDAAYDVVAYEVKVAPDIDSLNVDGWERITFIPRAPSLQTLTFSANSLDIEDATFDGSPAAVEKSATATTFRLSRDAQPGRTSTLQFRFHGKPSRGLYRSKTLIYSSYFTCDWMVCNQDRLDERARFSLRLQLPDGVRGFASGEAAPEALEAVEADGMQRHFVTPAGVPAYLAGFVAGNYVTADDAAGGRAFRYVSDVQSPAELAARFEDTGRIAAFFESKAGVALPAARYTQVLVAGSAAQEGESHALLGTEAFTGVPATEWSIAHEMAHQWWGKLLTSASLSEFWLNEGLATFMTAAWKEHAFGRPAYQAELEIARQRHERAKRSGEDHVLAWPGKYANLSARRAIQYSKAALFLDALRQAIGDEAFWNGLRRYTRDNAGKLVRSEAFEAAMQAQTHIDLGPLFVTWVYGDRRSRTACLREEAQSS